MRFGDGARAAATIEGRLFSYVDPKARVGAIIRRERSGGVNGAPPELERQFAGWKAVDPVGEAAGRLLQAF